MVKTIKLKNSLIYSIKEYGNLVDSLSLIEWDNIKTE